MKRKYFLTIVFVIGIVLLSLFIFEPQNEIPNKEIYRQNAKIDTTIVVDFDSERASASAKLNIEKGENALSLLKEKHEVQTKQYSFGDMVEAVDGVKGGDGRYWIYYVNGETAKVGASDYKLKEGDKILWRLEAEKK